MDQDQPQPQPESRNERRRPDRNWAAIFARLVPPIAILAVGLIGFSVLSFEPEEPKKPRGKSRPIKTQVVELFLQDYPTRIKTQGNVRPHNQITLNSEVSGRVIELHPNFEDGAFFKSGDILVTLDPADFKAAVLTAEAQLARMTAAYDMEKAQAQQAKENWERFESDEEPDDLVLRLPQMREAEANMNAASAGLERAQRNLERTQIRAPFDGRVRERNVGLGQAIRTNSPLGIVFATDYAEVRLPISGQDLPYLDLPEEVGDPPVEVTLKDAINQSNETVWKAQIIRTEGTLDTNSLELFAIAKVDDPFGQISGKPPLRIGQPVLADISGKVLQNVMPLPRLGVKRLDQIYLVDPKKMTLHNRTIAAIWADENHVIIRDPDIPDGMLMATTKLNYAPEGGQVEILPDINPEASATSAWLEAMGVPSKPKGGKN